MDLGLLYRALNGHQVDMAAGNSTDGPIQAFGLAMLTDDRHYFPRTTPCLWCVSSPSTGGRG